VKSKKYVIAVSGGVDSVALLSMLLNGEISIKNSKLKEEDIIIAHFDHGIRENSEDDRIFVETLAKKYSLKFYFKREELGPMASEALARERRYKFLKDVVKKTGSEAIITAHHQGDLIETAMINLLRGTNRRGLSSLSSNEIIIRPMLDMTKVQILDYAKNNNLDWREDQTNESSKYLRNRLRKQLNNISEVDRQKIVELIKPASNLNQKLDEELEDIFNMVIKNDKLDRRFFVSLSHKISKELLVFWLKKYEVEYDKKQIEKLTINLKTGREKAKFDIDKKYFFEIESGMISFRARTSV
jgi:tRNA(Ile)-lysidine synthetase-like protein